MYFSSLASTTKEEMLIEIHALLDEADAVIHYNGTSFDIPTLNKEFIQMGLLPPSPYKQIDLLKTARKKFRFTSNKLAFVASFLGLGTKTKHYGHELWMDCMRGDPKAWRIMETYNKNDVTLLQKVYMVFRPWIANHPVEHAYRVELEEGLIKPAGCPTCASKKLQARGKAVTQGGVYHRFQCMGCGSWSRTRYSEIKEGQDKKKILVGV